MENMWGFEHTAYLDGIHDVNKTNILNIKVEFLKENFKNIN